MLKFIKTFYLWLGLFTLCNLVSLGLALMQQPSETNNLFLYPVAWILQIPLALVIALAHFGTNHLFSFLPLGGKKIARFTLCTLIATLFMGTYAVSQLMYVEIHSFIAWDAIRVVLGNTIQILPDIGRNNTMELFVVGTLAALISLVYTRRYHDQARTHSHKLFSILCAAFLASGAGGFALIYTTSDTMADRIRQDLLPTTYMTLSIIDVLLPSIKPTASVLADLKLEPQCSMEDYLATQSVGDAPHVFFIMLESISWDHFGITGYPRKGVTPNIDTLAGDSIIFPRTYATANHSNYSQTSFHSSLYPLRRNYLDQFDTVDYPKTLLFDILSYAGYQTAFLSAQNEDWQGMKTFIHAHTELQHFFHSKNELGNKIGIESKIDDQLVCSKSIEFLENRDTGRPLFMYLNFQKTHFPYELKKDAARPYQPCSTDHFDFNYFNYDRRYVATVINKYDNALHYVDQQVGTFIEHLKQNGLYENSLIVVAADHGEAFYERGYPTHSTTLYDDQIRTSTFFKLPSTHHHEVRSDAISLIDINPTILEILGLSNHPNFQGQPVLDKPREGFIYLLSHAIIKTHGIVDYPWKYISCQRDGERLINVEQDPQEATDQSNRHPKKLRLLKKELEHYQQRQMYYYNGLPQKERNRFYPPQH